MEERVHPRGYYTAGPKVDRSPKSADDSNSTVMSERDVIKYGIEEIIRFISKRTVTTMNEILDYFKIAPHFRGEVSKALSAYGIKGKPTTKKTRTDTSFGRENVFLGKDVFKGTSSSDEDEEE